MTTKTFKQFFISEIQRLYGQEQQIARILPKLERSATAPDLMTRFSLHAKEVATQLERLEQVFKAIGTKATARTCPRVEGLCADIETIAGLEVDPCVRNVALIAAAQHFTHDEIAGYGCARTWAQLLRMDDEAALLQRTLEEKKVADMDLTRLSKVVNKEAMSLTA